MVDTEPHWLSTAEVLAFHALALARFGGSDGVRDFGLLSSALDRPRNLWAYERANLPLLAAAYAEGVAKNHPFIDGNKRAALIALMTFVELNGHVFKATQIEAFQTILALATGDVTELELAAWVRRNIEAV